MHYAILNRSGNALGWFTDEAEARAALEAMTAESPDADLDLVEFKGDERPAEPVTVSVRSAWPSVRLVVSSLALSTGKVAKGEQGQPVYVMVVQQNVSSMGAASEPLPRDPDNDAGPVPVGA